jgi:hypothetical protein
MQQFYRDIIDNSFEIDLCTIFMKSKEASAIEMAAIHVLAQLLNPAFGDTYSFPWTRGPHD